MNAFGLSAVLALLAGTLAYAGLRWAWPTIPVVHFANIIGIVAIVGGLLGVWLSRRRSAGRDRNPSPPSSHRHD